MGIPQESLISLVLYLIYNADLLKICENIQLRISSMSFIDNINILTHSLSIEQNYDTLK